MTESSTKADVDLQADLKRAQKATQQGPHFFALLVKGGGEGRLIVSRRKIPDKQVAEAKKAASGATVVKGLCFGEDGQLVFETAKAPAPAWLVTVKKQAKGAGLSALNATFRQGRDDESVAETTTEAGEDGAPTAPPQPEAAPDAAAEWQRRAAGVTDRVKAATAVRHPAARDMILGVSEAQTLFRRGDAAAAEARLAKVEALLAPSPKPTAADPAAAFKARFAEWQAVIKQALLARPPDAADIAKLVAQATSLGKPGGDPAQALAKLTQCHALAKAVLAGGTAAKQPTADPPAEYKARFAEWQAVIKQALLARPPNAADIAKLMAQATALSKPGGNIGQALAHLTECHKLATAALRAPRPDPTSEAGKAAPKGAGEKAAPKAQPGGAVALGKIKLNWERAKKEVGGRLQALHDTILQEFKDPESAKSAKKLDRILARFNEGLGDTLDDLYTAEPDKRPALRQRAAKIAANYLDFLDGDPLVKHVEDNPFADIDVRQTLAAPLEDLEAQLALAPP